MSVSRRLSVSASLYRNSPTMKRRVNSRVIQNKVQIAVTPTRIIRVCATGKNTRPFIWSHGAYCEVGPFDGCWPCEERRWPRRNLYLVVVAFWPRAREGRTAHLSSTLFVFALSARSLRDHSQHTAKIAHTTNVLLAHKFHRLFFLRHLRRMIARFDKK